VVRRDKIRSPVQYVVHYTNPPVQYVVHHTNPPPRHSDYPIYAGTSGGSGRAVQGPSAMALFHRTKRDTLLVTKKYSPHLSPQNFHRLDPYVTCSERGTEVIYPLERSRLPCYYP